jgi:hypothetical protein
MQKMKVSEMKERMRFRLEDCLLEPYEILRLWYRLQGELYSEFPITVGRAPLSEIYELLLELYRKL